MKFSCVSVLAMALASIPSALSTNVDLDIACQGISRISDFTLSEKVVVAHALQDSYNTIHGEVDNDDSTLDHVTVSAGRYNSKGELIPTEGLGWYPNWNGDWNCRWCFNVDDYAAFEYVGSSPTHKQWEAEFTKVLQETNHKSFNKISSCSINMKAHQSKQIEEVEETEMEEQDVNEAYDATSVNIAVKCKGVSFEKLSVSDDTIAGRVLQDAYNKVHIENNDENDDSELSNVHWGSSVGSSELGWYPNWNGDWNCRWCFNVDDYSMETVVGGSTGSGANKKWENEFILGLIETGRSAFKDVKKCDIQLTAAGSMTVDEEAATGSTVGETTKCGLRACSEE